MGGIYWLASYPKSGNTWFRLVLANYREGGEEPVEINALRTGPIASSRIWVDDVAGFDTADLTQSEIESLRPHVYRWTASETAEPGFHKIHDAYRPGRDGSAVLDRESSLGAVYILRNPLDVAVSYAAHNAVDADTAIAQMGDPEHALARSGKALPEQLLQFVGSWSHHVLSWLDGAEVPVHLSRYEDMLSRPAETFGAALSFLGLEPEPSRLRRAIDFSQFDRLRRAEGENGFRERPWKAERFFREGRSGGWRRHLSASQVARIVADHGSVMERFGYLDAAGNPV